MHDLQKALMNDYEITVHSYENAHVNSIPEFLKEIDKITAMKSDSIIQLLDTDYICGEKHLNQGISQAFKAFNEKQNFANDKGLEICVRTSAQKQISKALKILGIKRKGNITVIYINTTSEQINHVESLMPNRNDSLLNKYDIIKIRKTYDLKSDNAIDELNEKIALLSLKN